MSKSIRDSYTQGFQILHNNLYLFWVNLVYIIPFAFTNLFPKGDIPWIFVFSPFIVLTLKLTDTQLLFEQPQTRYRIMETYGLILYKYLFRVVFLLFFTTIVGLIIFTLCGGSVKALLAYAVSLTSQAVPLEQKLIAALPLIILTPIIPFFQIFWVVKKQSFLKSISSGFFYAFRHMSFSLIAPVVGILTIIIQHPISRYLDKSNSLIFAIINIYLGLVMTSASIVYFKAHKE